MNKTKLDQISFKMLTITGMQQPQILIDSYIRLAEYEDFCTQWAENAIAGVMASGLGVESFDHYYITPHSCWGMACMIAVIRGSNPIYLVNAMVQEKILNMREALNNDEQIIVNQNAGYCYLNDEHEVTETKRVRASDYIKTIHIDPDADVLVLENDPLIPASVTRVAKRLFDKYSTMCCLRHYSDDEIVNVMDKHTELFVQTTALDFPQLQNYVQLAIRSNIQKITFDFTCDPDWEVTDFIDGIADIEIVIL